MRYMGERTFFPEFGGLVTENVGTGN